MYGAGDDNRGEKVNLMDHQKQKETWEKEHGSPSVLPQMDKSDASSGVKRFLEWLRERKREKNLAGIEMGCGKGRNSIWLTKQGVRMTAFDFSRVATMEAMKRAKEAGVGENLTLLVHDASEPWPFESNMFDIAIDCFASTDIESFEHRAFARDELRRVLKPGGYLFVYTLSTDDEFHKEMIKKQPAGEKNSFLHPAGKFEKVFDRDELLDFYKDFTLIEERRIEKDEVFGGKTYHCRHFWVVLQKS